MSDRPLWLRASTSRPADAASGDRSETLLRVRYSASSSGRPATGETSDIAFPCRLTHARLAAPSSPVRSWMPSSEACRDSREARSESAMGAPGTMPSASSTTARRAGSRNGVRSATSVSALSPMPSPSTSAHSSGSNGNASSESATPSLSSSVSANSPMPSPSKSDHSFGSSGAASTASTMPSPSVSGIDSRLAAA